MARWFVLLCLALLAACAAATPTPTPTPIPTATPLPTPTPPPLIAKILPDAETTFRYVSGHAPFTVAFRAEISGGTPPYAYEWDFDGDGTTDSIESTPPPFVYHNAAAYNAALIVTDANGQDARVERRIVAFQAPRLPAWQYGVAAPLERRYAPYFPTLNDVARAAKIIHDANIQFVRMDFNWDLLNPTRDEWQFDDYDAVVNIVRARQLEVLGVLDYASWWASSAQTSNDWRVRLYSEPTNAYDFARYAYAVVNHFKNDVRVWQIWNQPNTQTFWKPQPNPARYVALLQEAYLAAKYADPDAVIVFGGLSGNGVAGGGDVQLAGDFLENAYRAGARGFFDVMAIHPYLLPNSGIATLRAKIAATRAVMNQFGDQAIPLWLTEIGAPTDVTWWSNAPPQSEADAANWLQAVFTQLWDLTPTIVWYELQDRAGDDAADHFGLLRADGTPKRGYETLQKIIAGSKK